MIRELGSLPPEVQARIHARVGPQTVLRITSTPQLEWLEIETHSVLLTSILEALGAHEFVAFYRRVALSNFRSRLLSAIAVNAARVFGRAALLHAFPRGWNLVVRGCGKLSVNRNAERGFSEVVLSDVPPILLSHAAFRLSLAAVLAATLDLGGYIGQVKVDEGTIKDGALHYTVSLIVEPEGDPAG